MTQKYVHGILLRSLKGKKKKKHAKCYSLSCMYIFKTGKENTLKNRIWSHLQQLTVVGLGLYKLFPFLHYK